MIWFRALTVMLLCALCLPAEIAQLVTSGDGETLLFRSTFRLTSETELGAQGKIYRWHNGQWTNLDTAAEAGANRNPPNVFNPFLSSAGDVFGWQTDAGCFTCIFRYGPYYSSKVFGVTLPENFPRGNLQMSANGRYFTADTFPVGGAKYLDSLTGTVSDIPISVLSLPAIRQVANDGKALLFQGAGENPSIPQGLSLWKPGTNAILIGPVETLAAALSAEGGRVASEEAASQATQSGTRALIVQDTNATTGRMTHVLFPFYAYSPQMPAVTQPAWDAAGLKLIYRDYSYLTNTYELQLWEPFNASTRTILSTPDGVANAAISGDGNIVWAVTGNNRLLRLNPTSDQSEEVLPPLPTVPRAFDYGVPGSAYFLRGSGFTTDHEIFDNGISLPVLSLEADGVYVQIPWEAERGTHNLAIRSKALNPFESVARVDVDSSPQPNLVTLNHQAAAGGYAKALHEDFSGQVTSENPALAGETIHIYLTGLGPLDGALHPLAALSCTLAHTPVSVAGVTYAGGFYQADIVLPNVVPSGESELFCAVSGSDFLHSSTAWINTAPRTE